MYKHTIHILQFHRVKKKEDSLRLSVDERTVCRCVCYLLLGSYFIFIMLMLCWTQTLTAFLHNFTIIPYSTLMTRNMVEFSLQKKKNLLGEMKCYIQHIDLFSVLCIENEDFIYSKHIFWWEIFCFISLNNGKETCWLSYFRLNMNRKFAPFSVIKAGQYFGVRHWCIFIKKR